MSAPTAKVELVSTALYRRYRPDTFDEVIGQEHVTEPLKAALRAGKVTHAYLFSGPRGCGKTTSARIMARCLNCAEGPTDTPCGKCESCRELATGGPGSLDVVEIDAASHNKVEDARALRERATFSPVRDRYKVYILDEAHMVTTQGFNALLKLVEEPPEHVKFIFATTEPDKVIGTIRSRTHHYPFRLVPPDVMETFLEGICRQENVSVAPGVLPLVVRAGAGSVRDSLSVLDQLVAGVDDGQLDYDETVALLGYTDATILDETVSALAAKDAGAVFTVIDRMIESGHDPRRFVEDLLQRLRDLVIVSLAGDGAPAALHGIPEDQLERMRVQAKNWGAGELTFAASQTNEALSQMKGATSPRLQVELLAARLLLGAGVVAAPNVGVPAGGVPGAAGGVSGEPGGAVDKDFDNLTSPAEIRKALAKRKQKKQPQPAAEHTSPSAPEQKGPDEGAAAGGRSKSRENAPEPDLRGAQEDKATSAGQTAQGGAGSVGNEAAPDDKPVSATEAAGDEQAGANTGEPSGRESSAVGSDSQMIRRRWGEILDNIKRHARATWMRVQEAQPSDVTDGVLTIVVPHDGIVRAMQDRRHVEIVSRAIYEVVGEQLDIKTVTADQAPMMDRVARQEPPVSHPEPVADAEEAPNNAPAVSNDAPVAPTEEPQSVPEAGLEPADNEGDNKTGDKASQTDEPVTPQGEGTDDNKPEEEIPASPTAVEPEPVQPVDDGAASFFKQWASDHADEPTSTPTGSPAHPTSDNFSTRPPASHMPSDDRPVVDDRFGAGLPRDEAPDNVTAFPGRANNVVEFKPRGHADDSPADQPASDDSASLPDDDMIDADELMNQSETVEDPNGRATESGIELAQRILGGTIINDEGGR